MVEDDEIVTDNEVKVDDEFTRTELRIIDLVDVQELVIFCDWEGRDNVVAEGLQEIDMDDALAKDEVAATLAAAT